MEKNIILEAKSLRKHFGGIKAVDDISLMLHKGEIIGIVGDNGAGKSTFIKIISGVYKKYGGEIAITGGPKIKSTSEVIQEIAAKFKNEKES